MLLQKNEPIYVIEGQEAIFDEFVSVAILTISKYNGRLLFRVRPQKESYIELQIKQPYDIHLVEFDALKDFQNFKKEEERKKFLNLKEQSTKSSILYLGQKM